MALTLLKDLATEHLNGICEQSATTCLRATETHCVPENETLNMVRRGGEQTSCKLDCRQGLVGPSHTHLKKRYIWSEYNHRHTIKIELDNKKDL